MCLLTLAICAPFSSHDWQRAVQISVALCAVVYGLCLPQAERCVDRPTVLGVWLIGLAGLVSALLAHQPLWALTELALLISCGAIAVAFCRARRNGDESLDRVLILFVLLLCMIKSVQYLHAGVLAFTSGESVVDPDLLLSGFSNKRFYGQLQTFTLPLLALPLLVSNVARPARAAVFALLCVWSRILLCLVQIVLCSINEVEVANLLLVWSLVRVNLSKSEVAHRKHQHQGKYKQFLHNGLQ